MLKFNQQFLSTMSEYLDQDIQDRKQLESKDFSWRDKENFPFITTIIEEDERYEFT